MRIRKVHVLFKSHLDLGFTDLAAHVVDHYVHRYIPEAIRLAERVNEASKPPRFVWTVGAYLVDYALRTEDGPARQRLAAAVERGDIAYHALPYTLHSELCDPALFQAGLDIAARLDRRFGSKTLAAKMTDVPGHTAGIIGPLAEAGVTFLHIGINAVARGVAVPPLFVWEDGAGRQVLVNYTRSYGGRTIVDGHDEALVFYHADDNSSPPTPEDLEALYARLEAEFPDAEVFASTLDAFARSLERIRDRLPVVRGEMGDTWIHGAGSDPWKTATLRALCRLSASWDQDGTWSSTSAPLPDGRSPRAAFLENLLLVCEHTWGLDTKKFLTDFRNWNRPDFERAWAHDRLEDAYGDVPGYEEAFRFARAEFEKMRPEGLAWTDRSYSLFTSSHQEQRAYLEAAISLLPEALQDQARVARDQAPQEAEPDSGGWSVSPDAARGALTLTAPNGLSLRLGLPVYQEVGLEAYDRLVKDFLVNVPAYQQWAVPDNCKPGLEYSDAPRQTRLHMPVWDTPLSSAEPGTWTLTGRFPMEAVLNAGCPERFELSLRQTSEGLLIALALLGKAANRKPEALFLPMEVPGSRRLLLLKIGTWVDAAQSLPCGNERVHGVQAFCFEQAQGTVRIEPLDSPLLAIDAPALLSFDRPKAYDKVWANLYNNLWGTNFPMWYGEDIVCRFLVRCTETA